MTRILIVDDERDVIEYLADVMDLGGWQTSSAVNGVEAVLKVMDGGIDAVIMDIRMPKLDGVNALRIMKRIQPDLPVIMLTGQAGQGDMYESTRLGAFTCLMKPVEIDKLIETVRKMLAYKTVSPARAFG
ncbi:MAG: response regulator [Anaerolineae bacterium]|nr:response regulator [Anaerolineae bacterium]